MTSPPSSPEGEPSPDSPERPDDSPASSAREESGDGEDFSSGEEELAGLLGALARGPEALQAEDSISLLHTGQLIGGKFRLRQEIGRGGMGAVWSGEHASLGTPVAVKLLHPRFARDEAWRVRFEREARAAVVLRSTNVVQVFDHGVSGDVPYIVMELLEGESLRARLRREGTLPGEVLARVLAGVARAIARALTAGVVHRDLKPDNIFLARDADGVETIKVLDFGIAKLLVTEGSPESMTGTGVKLGTLPYMSPEQLRGSKLIDTRADLWAIGVIAFECLLGRRPFPGDGVAEIVLQVCSQPAPVPSAVGPVPAGFDAWFERTVRRDIDQRFQGVEEQFESLVDVLMPGQRMSLNAVDTVRSTVPPGPGETRAHGVKIAGSLAVGGALLGAALVIGYSVRPSAPAPPNLSPQQASSSTLSPPRASHAADPATAALRAELAQQGWALSGEGRDSYALQLDPEQLRNGRPTLALVPLRDAGGRYAIWMRRVDARPYIGKRIRVSSFMKTEGATKRADFGARIQASDSAADGGGPGGHWYQLAATSDWTMREVVVDVTRAATRIEFGAGIAGPGRLWMDAPTIEVVGDDVPLSGHEHDLKPGD
jgi:eukaryotic-like serine/threonine-protein kinase